MNHQITTKLPVSWCAKDQRHFFDHYADFNAWLEEIDDAQDLRGDLGLDNLSQPTKALFAVDKAQYDQAFEQYKTNRRQEILSRDYLQPTIGCRLHDHHPHHEKTVCQTTSSSQRPRFRWRSI